MLVTKQFGQAYFGPSWYANYIYSIIQTSDGGYFLLEYSGRWSPRTEVSIIKTDRNGYVEWRKALQYGAGDVARIYGAFGTDSVKQTSDGGFVVSGYMEPGVSKPTGVDPRDGFLMRFDVQGNKVWDVVLDAEGYEWTGPVEIVPGGGFVVSGVSYSPSSARDAFLARVGDNGQVIWRKRYDGIGGVPFNQDQAFDVEVDHGGGGFVLAGVTRCSGVGCGFLARTDAAGNLTQVTTARLENSTIMRVARAPDGGYVLVGNGYFTPETRQDAIIVKMDGSASVQWIARYDFSGMDEDAVGLDVARDGIRAVGSITPGRNVFIERPCFYHVDWDGRTVAQECLPETGIWYAVRATVDGATVVGGPYGLPQSSFATHDAYLLKFKESKAPGYLSGALVRDTNLSCMADVNEEAVGSGMVRAVDQNANVYLVPAIGTYSATVPPGNYRVSLIQDAAARETCEPGATYGASVVQARTSGVDEFALADACVGTVDINSGQLGQGEPGVCPAVRPTTPCPGRTWTYCATVKNNGTLPWAPKVQGPTPSRFCITPDPDMSFTGVFEAPPMGVRDCRGADFEWTQVPMQNPGDPLCFEIGTKAFPEGKFGGASFCQVCPRFMVAERATAPWTTAVTLDARCVSGVAAERAEKVRTANSMCSCDPNDLQVSPQGCGARGAINGQALTYTVRFQNVGAGPAHDVIIRDPLDEDLDPSTLRLESSSHRITGLQINPDNELVIRFEGIELPPEAWDKAGSNGSVTFVIQPKMPYDEGTLIDNGAAIFFDSNPPVMTNKVVNTLYTGGVVPVASFRAVHRSTGVDFSYTGGSTGISYEWNFGADATPSVSTTQDPRGVIFSGGGLHPVTLTVAKDGCASATSQDVSTCVDWSTSAFESPMGKPRQVGAMLPLKFRMYHQGQVVSSTTQLEVILASEHGWTPEKGCWPKARVLSNGQEVALGDGQRCFQFDAEGKLALNLKLEEGQFRAGQTYEIEVENLACTLAPDNNFFQVKN